MKLQEIVDSFWGKLIGVGTGITFLLMASAAPLKAASVGGAETNGKGKLAVSTEEEVVSGRKMKTSQMNVDETIEGVRVYGTADAKYKFKSLNRTMAKISYGVLDNLDLYAKIGVAGGKVNGTAYGIGDWTAGEESGKGSLDANSSMNVKTGLPYGFGLKATYDRPKWLLGIDAQCTIQKNNYSANASATFADLAGGGSMSVYSAWTGKLTTTEWQVAPYIGKKIGERLTAYGGPIFNDMVVEQRDEFGGKEKFRAKDKFGGGAGINCKLGKNKNWNINLEGQYVGGPAGNIAVKHVF